MEESFLESWFLQKLADKKIAKETSRKAVTANFDLLPDVFAGLSYLNNFVALLDSKYRILTWNAMAALANLYRVDKDKKFDAIFFKYFGFLNNEYLVTVANVVVGNSGKIAVAKPFLVPKITQELLKVEGIKTTEHLTEECKRVIAERTLESFSQFFEKMDTQDKLSMVTLRLGASIAQEES